MKVLLAVTALLMSGSAYAQLFTNPQPSMNMPNDSTFASSLIGRDPFPRSETLAVRREKLREPSLCATKPWSSRRRMAAG